MKEETFLETPVMCRRVFLSAASAADHLELLLCWRGLASVQRGSFLYGGRKRVRVAFRVQLTAE